MDRHTPPSSATHPDARTATPHAWTQRQAEFERCTNQPTDPHTVFDHFCYGCGDRINPPACSLTHEERCDPNHPSVRGHERCFI